jgi:uncharacterized protein (DUF433 family)
MFLITLGTQTMAIDRVVADAEEAVGNIQLFATTKLEGPLSRLASYSRNWYAAKNKDGAWMFGPLKFIGYVGNRAAIYGRDHDEQDGRVVEAALMEWFEPVKEGHPLDAELRQGLRRFLASHGKSLHRLAKIHVLKQYAPGPLSASRKSGSEDWRITSNPEILAGKPCIRGMRIRVADILEMLAGGASRAEILQDYPYLEDGDITAALEYAVGAVDHRLVRVA